MASARPATASYLNVMDADTGRITVLRRFDGVIEAPNWVQGEEALMYNADGRLHRYDMASGEDRVIDLGPCDAINNDHVLSPDGTQVAVSHMTFDAGFTSRVYIAPVDGGAPRLVTPNSPSFLHGWSPDGRTLSYCAFREIDGKRCVDVYTIPADGGEETRLTEGGFNDGAEFAPDGTIWFNSTRGGLMQAWHMDADGANQVEVTDNDRNNWFPHVSPDGRRVVYISYRQGDLEPEEHLPNMEVELWLMDADGSNRHRIATLFGGQGSMNVNSWAADSRRFAFVSYEAL
ncbi:MAG: transporter [Clostridiales bacterium]|nr:transporter [Clostridiales bacterium]